MRDAQGRRHIVSADKSDGFEAEVGMMVSLRTGTWEVRTGATGEATVAPPDEQLGMIPSMVGRIEGFVSVENHPCELI